MRLVLLTLVSLVAAACGTSMSFIPLNSAPQGAGKSPDQVELFAAGPPARPYTEIGMIEAGQESSYSHADAEEILGKMREYAAELGCDALVISGADATESALFSDRVDTLKGYRGVCIVYSEPAPPPARPPQTAAAPRPAAPPRGPEPR